MTAIWCIVAISFPLLLIAGTGLVVVLLRVLGACEDEP